MRTIGSIERILVVGIVLVIGTILIVAIKGAGDFDQAQRDRQTELAANGRGGSKKEAAAKGGERSNQPKPLQKPAVKPQPPASERDGLAAEPPKVEPDAGDLRGNAPPESGATDPQIDELIRRQLEALNGNAAGAKEGAGAKKPDGAAGEKADGKAEADAAPLVVEDDLGIPHPAGPKEIAPAPEVAKEYTYEVRSGDSLERIARAVYGDGSEWRAILAANPQAGDGQMIRTGDKLKLPKPPTQGLDLCVATTAGGAVVKSEPAKSEPAKAKETPPANGNGTKSSGFQRVGSTAEHTVAKGDTLMSIALDHYGTKAAWKLIYDANQDRIPDKDRIKVGVVLRLPAQ